MSAAIVRVSVALGTCAALFNLLLWHQQIMEMASGHTWAFRVLYVWWFVLGWGIATGALTGLAISSMRLRSPGRKSAATASVVSLFLTSTVCLVLHRGLTDDQFMHDAMSGMHPGQISICRTRPALTGFNRVEALTPNVIAVALSVFYAFGGMRRRNSRDLAYLTTNTSPKRSRLS
jgi:hypothetical protein